MIQQGAIARRKPNDPPGKPVGFERLRQAAGVAASLTIHRASRWDSLRNATLHRKAAAHPKSATGRAPSGAVESYARRYKPGSHVPLMPPACPVDTYARRYKPGPHVPLMPPACPVDCYARCYKPGPHVPLMPPARPVDAYARRYKPGPHVPYATGKQ